MPNVVVNQELRDRVIKAYTEKKMSLNVISKFICARKLAQKIIEDAGFTIPKRGVSLRSKEYNSGHLSYPTSWEELQKLKKRG